MNIKSRAFLVPVCAALLSSCGDPLVHVSLEEYPDAFRNPMKGLREYFDPGQDSVRAEYPYPYGSMIKEYMQWNMMEDKESDGVEKIKAYSDHRWAGVEKMNMKVIPRPFIVWVEPWHGGKPKNPGYPDDMDGWHWPSDLPGEISPYRQIPGSVGAYVDPADSSTAIIGGYFDPRFPGRVEKFVEKLGEAWDNDPRVAYVEMGIIGEWGEHHDPDISTFWPPHDEPRHVAGRTWVPGIEKTLGDAFSKAFKNKKVMVRYAYEFKDYEFGIYWDSWAMDEEIERGYNQILSLGDRWKTSVIGGEITWNWGTLQRKRLNGFAGCVADRYTHDLMLEQIRNLHCNHLGGVTWTDFKDEELMKNVSDIQKALGYRYVIREAAYGKTVRGGKPWKLSFSVTNTGSSPFYYDWPVEVSLLDPVSHEKRWCSVIRGADIRKWMPGEEYDTEKGCYSIPPTSNRVSVQFDVTGLDPGVYVVALAVLDPAGMLPSLRFANRNYFEGGYTVLGKVGVETACEEFEIPPSDCFDLQSDKSLHYLIEPAI